MVLELQYLFEIKRTAEPARVVVEVLQSDLRLQVCDLPFRGVAETALAQDWTRDPLDRLIVSQAVLKGAPLVTRDRNIRAHCPLAFWEQQPAPAGPEVS